MNKKLHNTNLYAAVINLLLQNQTSSREVLEKATKHKH